MYASLRTALCLGAAGIAMASAPALAAPVDLAAVGLMAADTPVFSYSDVGIAIDDTTAAANDASGSFFISGFAPYDATGFWLSILDIGSGTSLDATSFEVGFSDDSTYGAGLFDVTAADGAFASLSSQLYVVVDLPAGAAEQFFADGSGSFVTSVSVYETSAATPPSGVVPLPAAGILLLGALAGSGLVLRRRK